MEPFTLRFSTLATLCLAASVVTGSAQTNTATNTGHAFFCCDSAGNKVTVFSKDGTVEWQVSAVMPQDGWRLANGNYLYSYKSGVIEMTPEKKIAWEYKSPEKTEVHACQPLPDGRVMVVEAGTSRIVEVDREEKIAKEIKLPVPPSPITTHDQFRGTRKTKEGHYLVSCKGQHKIIELDGEGKVLREIPVPGDVHSVVPLAQGHLLISCGDGHKVMELDANEKVVWEVNENDLPGHPLRLMTGSQRLPNGNTILCNWLGHGHLGEQADVVEVTPDKKIVWEFVDHTHIRSINQIQVFDAPGDPAKGEILR